MARTTFQTIESLFEKKISIRRSDGAKQIFLFTGKVAWTNAWDTSPVLRTMRFWVAIASAESTGAKQSLVDQSFRSRLPRTTILYLALSGLPSLYFFIFDIGMDGRALPIVLQSALYSLSEIYSQVPVSLCRPMYSTMQLRSWEKECYVGEVLVHGERTGIWQKLYLNMQLFPVQMLFE